MFGFAFQAARTRQTIMQGTNYAGLADNRFQRCGQARAASYRLVGVRHWRHGLAGRTLPSRARRAERKQRRLSQCVPNAGEVRRPVAAGWQNLAAGRCAAQQLHARVHGNGRGRNCADAVVRLPTFGTAPPRILRGLPPEAVLMIQVFDLS